MPEGKYFLVVKLTSQDNISFSNNSCNHILFLVFNFVFIFAEISFCVDKCKLGCHFFLC